MSNNQAISKIFSLPDVRHGLAIFSPDEIKSVESLMTKKDGKYFIRCQIKNKNKVAKPEEIVRQLWIHRLLTEYGILPKE